MNRSVGEGRIESRHYVKSLEWMGSSSHDIGAERIMHSFTVDCEVICSEAMLALSFSTLLVNCLMKRLGRSALW